MPMETGKPTHCRTIPWLRSWTLQMEKENGVAACIHCCLLMQTGCIQLLQAPAAFISYQDRLYLELSTKTSPFSHKLFTQSFVQQQQETKTPGYIRPCLQNQQANEGHGGKLIQFILTSIYLMPTVCKGKAQCEGMYLYIKLLKKRTACTKIGRLLWI